MAPSCVVKTDHFKNSFKHHITVQILQEYTKKEHKSYSDIIASSNHDVLFSEAKKQPPNLDPVVTCCNSPPERRRPTPPNFTPQERTPTTPNFTPPARPAFFTHPTISTRHSKNKRHKLYADEPVPCGLCKRKIENKYLLHALGKYWHEKCLKCDFCRKPLSKFGTRFYFRQGAKFCQDDFLRTFGGRGDCSRCDEAISPTDYVLRFKGNLNYHLDCFKCSICDKRFCVGESVRITDPKITICKSCES